MKSYIIKLNHKYYNIVNWRHIIENLVNFTPSKGIVVGEMETGLKAWNLNSRDGDFAVLALVLRWLNLSVMIKISIFFFKLNLFDFFDLLLVLRLTFSSEVFLKPLIEIILQNRWMQLKKFYLLHWASIISIEESDIHACGCMDGMDNNYILIHLDKIEKSQQPKSQRKRAWFCRSWFNLIMLFQALNIQIKHKAKAMRILRSLPA